jgi:cell division protein FtsQ
MTMRRRFPYRFVVLLVGVVALVIAANLWKSKLTVGKIRVEGNRIVDTNEILQLAHVPEGAKLYDLDLMAIRNDVLSHDFVREVTVERDLPSTLIIRVIERSPIAIINRSEVRYLDQDGVVLPHSLSRELFDLPVISGVDPAVSLAVGSRIHNTDVLEALHILSTARAASKELYHLLSEVRLRNGGDILLYATDGGLPIIYGHGHAAQKLVCLEAFWKNIIRQRGFSALQYVDLRFEDQIVVRWSTSTKVMRTL